VDYFPFVLHAKRYVMTKAIGIKSNRIFVTILKQISLTASVQNVQKSFMGKFTKDKRNPSLALNMPAVLSKAYVHSQP
jgi:hypothetical protein